MVSLGLTLGGSVKGDPVKDIIKTAFENGTPACSCRSFALASLMLAVYFRH